MDNSKRLKLLIDSTKTIFKPVDLRLIWQEGELNAKIYTVRMVKKGLILKLAKGYYALNDHYNIYELANSVVSPSYVSFDSALFFYNLNFQLKTDVDSVSTLNYQKKINGHIYKYFSMRKELFYNIEGIIIRDNVSIASGERAVLDSLYFGLLPNIDNPDKLNKEYLRKLSSFYPKTVRKKAENFYE